MKRYSSNLVFIDLLFNLLVGFTSLFILAFVLINPIAKKATIDPPVLMMVEMRWPDESRRDIDLYIKGPNGEILYYGSKDKAYMILERDDLGSANDKYMINGQETLITRNYELATFTALPPGEYVINAHYFTTIGDPWEVVVTGTVLSPFAQVITEKRVMTPSQEITFASFTVDAEGKVYDVRTDLSIPVRKKGKGQ